MLYSIALPAALAMAALALDGGQLFVHRIHMQNAADAAALASSQDLNLDDSHCYLGPTDPSCTPAEQAAVLAKVAEDVNCYARENNAPVGNCGPAPLGGYPYPQMAACGAAWDVTNHTTDTNCFTWPYVKSGNPNWGKVEVRLRETVALAFGGIPGIPSHAHPSARSVAAFQLPFIPGTPGTPGYDITGTETIPGMTHTTTTVINGTTTVITTVTPGGTHTSTNVTFGNCPPGASDCGVAFAKSTACPAITYTGNGGTTIGSLETNGGFKATGNAPKHIKALYLGKYSGKTDLCYQNGGVATFDTGPVGPFSPQDWPISPPNEPTPVPLTQGTLSGNQCWSITSVSDAVLNVDAATGKTKTGVYCSTGTLNFSGQILKGLTFFAQCISVSGNSGDMEYYRSIPVSEGARQQTLFNASGTDDQCNGNAITIQGQNNILVGDLFAPNGNISMQGGGVKSGSGFLEAQTLSFAGTFPNYTGTGPQQGGSVTVVTTTDPSTTTFSTTVVGGSTSVGVTTDPDTTTSTTIHVDSTPSTPGSTGQTTIGLGE